jgi:hypothetical protein
MSDPHRREPSSLATVASADSRCATLAFQSGVDEQFPWPLSHRVLFLTSCEFGPVTALTLQWLLVAVVRLRRGVPNASIVPCAL